MICGVGGELPDRLAECLDAAPGDGDEREPGRALLGVNLGNAVRELSGCPDHQELRPGEVGKGLAFRGPVVAAVDDAPLDGGARRECAEPLPPRRRMRSRPARAQASTISRPARRVFEPPQMTQRSRAVRTMGFAGLPARAMQVALEQTGVTPAQSASRACSSLWLAMRCLPARVSPTAARTTRASIRLAASRMPSLASQSSMSVSAATGAMVRARGGRCAGCYPTVR